MTSFSTNRLCRWRSFRGTFKSAFTSLAGGPFGGVFRTAEPFGATEPEPLDLDPTLVPKTLKGFGGGAGTAIVEEENDAPEFNESTAASSSLLLCESPMFQALGTCSPRSTLSHKALWAFTLRPLLSPLVFGGFEEPSPPDIQCPTHEPPRYVFRASEGNTAKMQVQKTQKSQ